MARKTKCTEDHRCAMCGGMLNCQDHQSVWGQILAVRNMLRSTDQQSLFSGCARG